MSRDVFEPEFFDNEFEVEKKRMKRLAELEVLASELKTSQGKLFGGRQGELGEVLFIQTDRSKLKSDVNKELAQLRKLTKGMEKNELNF